MSDLTHTALNLVMKQEDFRSRVYKDMLGNWTWGYGTNIMTRDLKESEARMLAKNDVEWHIEKLPIYIPFFKKLSIERQSVLVSLAYNLGLKGLLQFKNMLRALREGDFEKASAELLDSNAAKQCPSRYRENANILATGRL